MENGFSKVYVDMDGVLVDFIGPALKKLGIVMPPHLWPKGEWDISKVTGIPSEEVWNTIDEPGTDFWLQLQAYSPDTIHWFRGLQVQFGVKNVIVCSYPTTARCFHQKSHWINMWLDHAVPRIMMRGCDKALLARPGVLLIDDNEKNTAEFVAAGGSAILFPRRWNAGHLFFKDSDGWGFADDYDLVMSVVKSFNTIHAHKPKEGGDCIMAGKKTAKKGAMKGSKKC